MSGATPTWPTRSRPLAPNFRLALLLLFGIAVEERASARHDAPKYCEQPVVCTNVSCPSLRLLHGLGDLAIAVKRRNIRAHDA